ATGKFQTIVPFKRCLLPCPLPWRASTFFDAHWPHEPDDQVSLSPGERVGVRGKDTFELPKVCQTNSSWKASTFFDAHWPHEPDGQVSLSPRERVGARGKDAFELPNVCRTNISWRASTFFYANWPHEPDGQVSLSPGERVGVRGNAPYNNEGLGKERGPGCSVSEVVCWLELGRSLPPHPCPLPKGAG